ncbi:MAG: class I SAM-dependent DNA methyltransferase, partial [Candidatus Thorarchaeota archaeon]
MNKFSSQYFLSYLNTIIRDYEKEKINVKTKDKSLGVIYTPNLIVDYLVSNVFRLFLEEFFTFQNSPKKNLSFEILFQELFKNDYLKTEFANKIKNIKILDPACGSGRFIISIAEKLYLFFKSLNPGLEDYEIKLNILQNNLYGIEVEKSACIIAKLRLISWLFSGNENYCKLFNLDERDLNLKEINNLIKSSSIKFNIFNLDFLLEFESGKFDIIIGNPPYVENKKIDSQYKIKLYKSFKSSYKLFDLSILFIEKSIELLKEHGLISFILPNKFLSADYGIKIREILIENIKIKEIDNISSLTIFQKTATYPIIVYFENNIFSDKNEICIKKFNKLDDLLTS